MYYCFIYEKNHVHVLIWKINAVFRSCVLLLLQTQFWFEAFSNEGILTWWRNDRKSPNASEKIWTDKTNASNERRVFGCFIHTQTALYISTDVLSDSDLRRFRIFCQMQEMFITVSQAHIM